MRSFILNLALALTFLATAWVRCQDPRPKEDNLAVSVPLFSNSTCPIMGKPVSSKLSVDTEKGRIYICCKGCNTKILKDVETAYKTAFPTTKKVANSLCPITGKKIAADSPRVVVQGHEISVCSKECVSKAQESSPIVLAIATNPKVVDIGNKTCPITAKPVEKNTFCSIGDSLVRLSSAQCIEDVKKAPKQTLEKAKEIVGKESKKAADAKR